MGWTLPESRFGHAAGDFFVPGGCDGGIVRFVEALDDRASKVSAFGDGQGKSFFQEFCGGFFRHSVILPRKVIWRRVYGLVEVEYIMVYTQD